MKHKNGYMLLESIISISIVLTISSLLYYTLFFTSNIRINVEDKVELIQQSNEISKYMKEIIENSYGIINHNTSIDYTNTTSIKCRYKQENINIKDKEISLKEKSDKVFINTLRQNGSSEPGGYEIGDYVDKMQIKIANNGNLAKIKLNLSKNDIKLEKEFTISIRNFKGV